MTAALSGTIIAEKLGKQFAPDIIDTTESSILVKKDAIPGIIAFLKNDPAMDFNFLNYITAVDYMEYFELVYQLTSITHNHSIVVKTRCIGREKVTALSIAGLYMAANPQEREIYDLMGIYFEGHPNMTRMFLWEGFEGHPQRKDYL